MRAAMLDLKSAWRLCAVRSTITYTGELSSSRVGSLLGLWPRCPALQAGGRPRAAAITPARLLFNRLVCTSVASYRCDNIMRDMAVGVSRFKLITHANEVRGLPAPHRTYIAAAPPGDARRSVQQIYQRAWRVQEYMQKIYACLAHLMVDIIQLLYYIQP